MEGFDLGESKSSTIQSVVVAVKILDFLAETGRPQRVTDIAAYMQATKARISRHLSTLSGLGLVVKMPDASGYRLGSTLFRLANAASEQYEITNIASRYMLLMRNQISEAMLLAMPAGGDAMIVLTMDSGRPLTPKLSRGTRFSIPISPTAWVVLAFSPSFIKERVLARRTDRELVKEDSLDSASARKICDEITKKYYMFKPDPHNAGFAVLSVPIFNSAEQLEAALSIVMHRRNQEFKTIPHLQQLKETAVNISRALGSLKMADELEASIHK